jgi:hypothetical protein
MDQEAAEKRQEARIDKIVLQLDEMRDRLVTETMRLTIMHYKPLIEKQKKQIKKLKKQIKVLKGKK